MNRCLRQWYKDAENDPELLSSLDKFKVELMDIEANYRIGMKKSIGLLVKARKSIPIKLLICSLILSFFGVGYQVLRIISNGIGFYSVIIAALWGILISFIVICLVGNYRNKQKLTKRINIMIKQAYLMKGIR